MKSNNEQYINIFVTTEIDGDIARKGILVRKEEFLKVEVVNHLIEEALSFNIKSEIRDAYLLCARLNYPEIYNEYFNWVDKYIDLTRPVEENLINIEVLYDINSDEIKTKQVIALNDEETIRRAKELYDIVMSLYINRNNYMKYQEMIGQLIDYADLIDMYYPELRSWLDKNKENKVSR